MPGGLSTTLDLLKEVNPSRIHADADSPSRLILIGHPDDTALLAQHVSAGTRVGPDHPWLRRQTFPEPLAVQDPGRTAAMLALGGVAWEAEAREAARRLRESGVPAVAVAVSRTAGAPPGPMPDVFDVPLFVLPALDADRARAALEAAVVPALLDRTPEERGAELALARQFPVFRRPYVRRLVEDTARANAWYAFSTGIAQLTAVLNLPVALADMLVLSKNQIIMAYKIALAAGREDRPRVLMGEVVGVIGAGLLFRQIARELVGLLPGVGLVPKVAVSYAGTRLIGVVVTAWALEGRKVEMAELRYLYDSTLAAGRHLAVEFQTRASARRDANAV